MLAERRAKGSSRICSDEVLHFVCFNDIKDDPDAVQRIKWAQIKSVDRAIEKMVRAYHQASKAKPYCDRSILAIFFWPKPN